MQRRKISVDLVELFSDGSDGKFVKEAHVYLTTWAEADTSARVTKNRF
jgi:hypothetical protein